jgi:hypothetical protein
MIIERNMVKNEIFRLINENDLSSALMDMYDIKNNFHIKKISHLPKDNDGTETTIIDCIDAVIDFLEQLERGKK